MSVLWPPIFPPILHICDEKMSISLKFLSRVWFFVCPCRKIICIFSQRDKGTNRHPGHITCVHQFDKNNGILQVSSQNSNNSLSRLSTWTSVSMQVVEMILKVMRSLWEFSYSQIGWNKQQMPFLTYVSHRWVKMHSES
jgi:hypothetical protein